MPVRGNNGGTFAEYVELEICYFVQQFIPTFCMSYLLSRLISFLTKNWYYFFESLYDLLEKEGHLKS